MPNGRTIHSSLGIPFTAVGNKWLNVPSHQQLARLQSRVDVLTLCLVVIDEVSNMGPIIFAHVDSRLQALMGSTNPFGGLAVILLGDFFQLPAVVPSEPLYAAVIKQVNEINLDTPGVVGSPRSAGTSLFASFIKIEFTQQMRAAADPNHMSMLNRMRSPILGEPRVTEVDLAAIRTLTETDIIDDPHWATTPMVVTSSGERIHLIDIQSSNFSRQTGQPRIIWNIPLLGSAAAILPQHEITSIYANNNKLRGHFVVGAKGYLTKNINPSRSFSNGSAIEYHSLTLHGSEDKVS